MEETASFRCGPYLLAPAWDSMTVAWESSVHCCARVSFAEGEGPFCPAFAVPAVPDAPRFQGKQMALFRWTLEQLQPGVHHAQPLVMAAQVLAFLTHYLAQPLF